MAVPDGAMILTVVFELPTLRLIKRKWHPCSGVKFGIAMV